MRPDHLMEKFCIAGSPHAIQAPAWGFSFHAMLAPACVRRVCVEAGVLVTS
jgi:hypothetical protein